MIKLTKAEQNSFIMIDSEVEKAWVVLWESGGADNDESYNLFIKAKKRANKKACKYIDILKVKYNLDKKELFTAIFIDCDWYLKHNPV